MTVLTHFWTSAEVTVMYNAGVQGFFQGTTHWETGHRSAAQTRVTLTHSLGSCSQEETDLCQPFSGRCGSRRIHSGRQHFLPPSPDTGVIPKRPRKGPHTASLHLLREQSGKRRTAGNEGGPYAQWAAVSTTSGESCMAEHHPQPMSGNLRYRRPMANSGYLFISLWGTGSK